MKRRINLKIPSITIVFSLFIGLTIANVNARSALEWGEGILNQEQKKFPRVRSARSEKGVIIDSMVSLAGIQYPCMILIRAFKRERELDLWAYSTSDSAYIQLKTYKFTSYSGTLGPKRAQGDLQIPEGFYKITNLNPASKFHLSLQINYPNNSDRIQGEKGHLGGEIFIHGSNVTIGCIPLGNDAIKELYTMVLDSKDAGYEIPVHIFPCRFDDSVCIKLLESEEIQDTILGNFWKNLKEGYEIFNEKCQLPAISVDSDGEYHFSQWFTSAFQMYKNI